jgi:hypothetical protein
VAGFDYLITTGQAIYIHIKAIIIIIPLQNTHASYHAYLLVVPTIPVARWPHMLGETNFLISVTMLPEHPVLPR